MTARALPSGDTSLHKQLTAPIDLGGKPAQGEQTYHIATTVVTYDEQGKRLGAESYSLDLACWIQEEDAKSASRCECRGVTIKRDDGTQVSIPALIGWSYPFALRSRWYDEQGHAYGVKHEKFIGLTSSDGEAVSPDAAYQVYSLFHYFHDFTHGLFSGANQTGPVSVGQRVPVEQSASEISLEFGNLFTEESVFVHDEMALEVKGLSVVNDAPAVILGFASGGRLTMVGNPAPNMTIRTVGRSQYQGDAFVDLNTLWVSRVRMSLTDAVRVTMGQDFIGRFILVTSLVIAQVK
jgi:hypothetical protein